MKIKRLIGGNLESNGYIVYDKEGGEGWIVDPGYRAEAFMAACEKLDVTIKGLLLTHYHYDHVGAVDKLKTEWGCPVYLHRGDCDLYKKPVDVMLEGGERFAVGDETLVTLHTPGHTQGGVCFLSESDRSKAVFTGDTIFNVDLGRTDLEGGSEKDMIRSISQVCAKWGNDMTIYPGHGDPATMKFVREHNQEYLDCIEAAQSMEHGR